MPPLSQRKPDRSIDTTGQVCPYPLIQTRSGLKNLDKGQILEVITDNEASARDTIPALSEKSGYPCEVIPLGNAWRILIEKTD
jgi:TusA-related sulfurtransferase